MKHISLVCLTLARLFQAACYLFPLFSIYIICFNLDLAFKLGYFRNIIAYSAIQDPSAFQFIDKISLLIIETLSLLPTLLIFYGLQKLFISYAKAAYFTTQTISTIKRIGTWMLLGQLLRPVYQCLMSLYLTRYNAAGHHLISLSMGTQELTSMLTALILFICAHITHQARLLERDNALTI